MENFSYHVPFFIVNGGVATSGHSSDLTAAKVGLFDRQTWSVATPSGNGTEFFLAQGAIGGKDWYGNPVKASLKSPFFFGKDVVDMYVSLPHKLKNEEWVMGYNGSPSSKSLTFKKGEPFRLLFQFTGDPAYRFFNSAKRYVVSYTPEEGCDTPCVDGCPEEGEDCLVHTQNLIDKINTHTELSKFGVKAKLVDPDFEAATPNMTKYCITICDNGEGVDLNEVKSQAPSSVNVVRVARSGALSTYEFCQPTTDPAPAAFQRTSSVLQAVCEDCPEGSFLVGAKDVFIVKRPIVGGEDFSTPATRDAYANAIWTAYASQESITTSTSTTSTTTAAGTANPDATWVGQEGSVAIVKLKFAAGTVLDPAIGTDIIVFARTEPAVCVFDAPASTPWETCGVGIRSQRTMRINNLNRPECDEEGDRLEDLQSILAGVVGIQINTLTKIAGDGCVDDYTVQQWSIDCEDEGCLTSNVTFHYDSLPPIEGNSWELVPVVVEPDSGRKCGIRISAGYIDPKFGNCSFDIRDYYEQAPVKFEIAKLDETGSVCDYKNNPTIHQSQVGSFGRQSGEYVVRQVIMKHESYFKHIAQFSHDPRMREAFDMNLLSSVDRNAYYKLYYITFKASYGQYTWRHNEQQEDFTAVLAVKESQDTAGLEANIIDVLTAKSGKVLHINE